MQSKVYFAGIRARSYQENKQNKIQRLFDEAGLNQAVHKGDLTAIKIHFGESGNDSYVNPVFVRPIADRVRAQGALPFLTDTNTLYGGSRANAVDHLQTAAEHGFGTAVAGAPVIIADGLKSDSFREVRIDKRHFKKVSIARRNCQRRQYDCCVAFQGSPAGGLWRRHKESGHGLRHCFWEIGAAFCQAQSSMPSYAWAARPARRTARTRPSPWTRESLPWTTTSVRAAASACASARHTPWTSTGLGRCRPSWRG